MKTPAPNKSKPLTIKMDEDVPYLTELESNAFKAARASGRVSFFQCLVCQAEKCQNEIPKVKNENGHYVKLYCSSKCQKDTEGDYDDSNKSDEGDATWNW